MLEHEDIPQELADILSIKIPFNLGVTGAVRNKQAEERDWVLEGFHTKTISRKVGLHCFRRVKVPPTTGAEPVGGSRLDRVHRFF